MKILSSFIAVLFLVACGSNSENMDHRDTNPPTVNFKSDTIFIDAEENVSEQEQEDNNIEITNESHESSHNSSSCNNGSSYAQDAENRLHKARNASDIEECHFELKKAIRLLNNALGEVSQCNCNDALWNLQEALNKAQRALDEMNLDEATSLARKAENSANQAASDFDSCKNDD